MVTYVQKREISLTHIESRPSKQDSEHYDFFVDCVAGAQIEAVINDLRSLSGNETYVLTRSVDTDVADTGRSDRKALSTLATIVAEFGDRNGDCRRIRQLTPKTETIVAGNSGRNPVWTGLNSAQRVEMIMPAAVVTFKQAAPFFFS